MPPEGAVALALPGLESRLCLVVHGDRDRCISRQLRERGIWEPFETELVRAALPPGGVFVDVGANLGYFTVLAADSVGEAGRVFAFEPDPDNARLLRTNVRRNGFEARVAVVEAGLAAADSTGQLFLSPDNLGDHQLFAAGEARRQVPVRLLHGANYLASRIARMDMLKIDTQGFEYEAMLGLLPLLRTLPTPRILIELTPLSLRQAGSSGRQLVELLAGLGQPLWIVDHLEHVLAPTTATELARWCDNVDGCAGDAGFMNILVGPSPL